MSESLDLFVTHETAYAYSGRVELAHHVGHLRPLEDAFQSVEQFELQVTPAPSSHSNDRDSFGNARVFFSIYSPHTSLKVKSSSRVRVRERFAGLDFVAGPQWEGVRTALHYSAKVVWLRETEFSFASPFVDLHKELRDYALVSFTPGRGLRAAALELMHRIHEDFSYESDTTEVDTPVIEVFRERRGVCQDFAHLLIACLRSLGLAARYVSGYLLTQPPPGQPRLVGADASHAWASVYCPDTAFNDGWIDLDPTNDLVPRADHVTLAVGRDYGDVAPLRGVIRGGGEHTLSVAVSVLPADELEPGASPGPRIAQG